MAKSSAPDPMKITLLSVGVVVALGVAGWRIMDAVAGSAPAPKPAATAAQAPAAVQTANSAAQRAEAPGMPHDVSAPEPGLPPVQMARHTGSEETLAFTVDPFAGFSRVERTATPPSSGGGRNSGGILLSPGPLPSGMSQSSTQPGPQVRVAPEAPPPLVGTLLGDSPGAVFRTDGGLQVVRRGEQIEAWRVVGVEHGSAILRSGRLTRVLTVHPRVGAAQAGPGRSSVGGPSNPAMAGSRSGGVIPISIPEGAPASPSSRLRENDPDVSPSEIRIPPTRE